MTAMTPMPRSRRRVVAAVSALLAALVLALLPLPSATTSAAAADGTAEDSAVTVTGKQGKYDDFSKLKVTVHQTKNLRSQGVRVTWQGGAPTIDGQNAAVNFLQIMQCWGDDLTGPDRDQCVFGGDGSILGAGNGRLVGTDPGRPSTPVASSRSARSVTCPPPSPPTTSPTSVRWTPTSSGSPEPMPTARAR